MFGIIFAHVFVFRSIPADRLTRFVAKMIRLHKNRLGGRKFDLKDPVLPGKLYLMLQLAEFFFHSVSVNFLLSITTTRKSFWASQKSKSKRFFVQFRSMKEE